VSLQCLYKRSLASLRQGSPCAPLEIKRGTPPPRCLIHKTESGVGTLCFLQLPRVERKGSPSHWLILRPTKGIAEEGFRCSPFHSVPENQKKKFNTGHRAEEEKTIKAVVILYQKTKGEMTHGNVIPSTGPENSSIGVTPP